MGKKIADDAAGQARAEMGNVAVNVGAVRRRDVETDGYVQLEQVAEFAALQHALNSPHRGMSSKLLVLDEHRPIGEGKRLHAATS